ncbi:guanylate kinase [Chloroflexota bacterium]
MEKEIDTGRLPFTLSPRSLLIVLSGPSGVGKDAVLASMKESDYPLKYVITLTTRPQRPNERENVDYHFVSTGRFQEMIENSELLEWANVYGNWYGVPKKEIKQALDMGRDTIVKVDTQGAASIRKILPQASLIFLMPPSTDDLLVRLRQRHTELPSDLVLRLKTAEEEIKKLPLFDYMVVNRWDEIDLTVSHIMAIITAEKCRVALQEMAL